MRVVLAAVFFATFSTIVRETAAESPTPPPLLARPTAIPGPAFQLFAVLQHRDDGFIYDRSKPLLSVDRVEDVVYDPRSRESRIVLLAADGKKLANITKQHGGETLLVISGNRLMVQWPVRVPVLMALFASPLDQIQSTSLSHSPMKSVTTTSRSNQALERTAAPTYIHISDD
jgi:hypothetical protein